MATKLDSQALSLVKRYKEDVKDSGFVIVEETMNIGWKTFDILKKKARRYKPTKSFHIKDVIPIHDGFMPGIVYGAYPVKYKKDTLSFEGRQGIFKIEFSDNTIMYASWYYTGMGKNAVIEGLFATENNTLYNFKKLLNKYTKRSQRPKAGFYKIFMGETGLAYAKVEHPSLIETIHPIIKDLKKDLTFFYDNVPVFTKYGMPGVRKAMLIGPPGTGKTSMCIKFAREYSRTHCVAVCTDIEAGAQHLAKCAHYNMPTVLIIEDAEATLSGEYGQGTSSSVLNFLDGVDQPTNKAGAYVMMTTNFPEKIEARILKRPGRIDRIYKVGPLKGKYALDCAKIYFDKDIKYTKKNEEGLAKLVSGMTGAQIRELANSTRAYCASNQLNINITTIKKVVSQLTEDISDAVKFAEDNSIMIAKEKKDFGFVQGVPSF
ncbi:AAA family ATPase [bacterium]|nr:AAA family ATPase [bacterium]